MFKVPFFGAKATEDSSARYGQICSTEFILDYLEKRNIPRIDHKALTLYRCLETGRGFINKGSFARISLYDWEIPIGLTECGYYENNVKIITKEYSEPMVTKIRVRVAVKKIGSECTSLEIPVIQFLNEIERLASFNLSERPDSTKPVDPYASCPHIINCYGYYCDDNPDDKKAPPKELGIIMEHAQEGFLSERIIQGLTYYERVLSSLGILEGLNALHANGIVHGDLKPANIFVCEDGSPRLGDLGCSFSGKEKIYFLSLKQYQALQKKSSLFDEYMLAIVKLSETNFKFVVKTDSLLEDEDDSGSKEKQHALTEIDCPENLLPMVSHLFSQHFSPVNQLTEIASLSIPWDDPIMRFLEENGYCGWGFGKFLAELDLVGSEVYRATELCKIYVPESKKLNYFRRRPNFLSDLYSLALILYEIWTGEIPLLESVTKDTVAFLALKIFEGLRPEITKMYSEQGLVEVSTLDKGDKLLKLKQLIIDAWDADPHKRTPLETLVGFFREWLHEILLELFMKNKAEALEELLEKMENASRFLLVSKDFQDQPYRKAYKISLAQYALWACSVCSPVMLSYIPESPLQLQKTELSRSGWVKDTDTSADEIIEKLLKAYNDFGNSETLHKQRLTWHGIGRAQRKLPVPLVWSYCEKRKIDLDIEFWYKLPVVEFDEETGSSSVKYSACYSIENTRTEVEPSYKEEKFSLLKGEISNKENKFSLPGFDLYREKNDFETLCEEVKTYHMLCM